MLERFSGRSPRGDPSINVQDKHSDLWLPFAFLDQHRSWAPPGDQGPGQKSRQTVPSPFLPSREVSVVGPQGSRCSYRLLITECEWQGGRGAHGPQRAIAASVRLVSTPGSCGHFSKPPQTRRLEHTAGTVPSVAGSPGWVCRAGARVAGWFLLGREALSWPRPVPRGPSCLG